MNPHTRSAPAAESASTAVLLPPIYLRTHMPLWKTHRSHIGTADLLPAKASHIPVSSYNLSFLPSFPGLTDQESFSLFYQLSQVSATGKQRFPLFPWLNSCFSRGGVKFLKVRLGTRGGPPREMVCGCFRFRDQEFLKFLIFAKSETKIHKLAPLRQCEFSFQRKTQKFKDF